MIGKRETVKTLIRCSFAVSDLGLHCLTMFQKWDTRFIWVKYHKHPKKIAVNTIFILINALGMLQSTSPKIKFLRHDVGKYTKILVS